MGGDEHLGAGHLVDLAALDADEAVLDHVEPPDALRSGARVELLDRLQHGDRLTVDRGRHPVDERQHELVRPRRGARRRGVRVDVLDRAVPGVLEEAGLDGAAPHVLVDRVRRLLVDVDGQALVLGEGDRLVAGHARVADRRDAAQVRGEGADADLEAHLVVALARAPVRDGGGAVLLGGGDEVLDDQRPRQRGHQRVAAHVEGVRLQRGQAEVVGVLVAHVGDDGLDGAAVERALADDLEVLAALADVGRDGDHLGAGLGGDPADGDGGVEASGVGEDDPVIAQLLLLVVDPRPAAAGGWRGLLPPAWPGCA